MKYLMVLVFTLLPFKVFAFPEIGDYARYMATFRGDAYEIKRTLTEYYPETNSFRHIWKLSKNGVVVAEESTQLPYGWFYTPKKIENVLSSCVKREGVLGEIIIQNQKVPSCTFFNEESLLDYSVGMVPFGQIRFQLHLSGEYFLDFNLVSFH
ncbi:MAG: hypothetical protein ACKOX6_07960 [Bdellovibrio sp.]